MLAISEPLILLVIIYLRVSTEEQATKGFSLPEQREACRAKAKELAQEVQTQTGRQVQLAIREFVDDFGGDIIERPVLEELRAFLKQVRPAYFVCLDPDRFARSLLIQMIVTDEIEAVGAKLTFVQHNYEKTAEGALFYQMRGMISQYEKTKILERTSRGKRGKVKAGGRPNGACPYGYQHDKELDQLRVFQPEARWVRQIFEWVATEHIGVHLVAKRLNELGVPTRRSGKRWLRGTVAQILRNPSYYGEMWCNRIDSAGLQAIRRLPRAKRRPLTRKLRPATDWKAVPVPTIVARQLWDQVQENLRTTTRRGKVRNSGLLSLIAYCGICGGRLSYVRQPTRTYLRCQYKYVRHFDYQNKQQCDGPLVRAEALEVGVWTLLTQWLTQPWLLETYLTQQSEQPDVQQELSRLADEAAALTSQQAVMQEQQLVIIRQQARKRLTEHQADRLLDELTGQLEKVSSRLASVITRMKAIQDAQGEIAATSCRLHDIARVISGKAGDVRKRLDSLAPEHRRELLLQLIRSVTVNRDRTWVVVL